MLKGLVNSFIEEYSDFISNDTNDCDEIARSLIKYLRNNNIYSQIVYLKNSDNKNDIICDLIVPYKNGVETYNYHAVVLCKGFVIDVNTSWLIMDYELYKKRIKGLNGFKKISWRIED